jgi:outer membrane protein assembly factor BamB
MSFQLTDTIEYVRQFEFAGNSLLYTQGPAGNLIRKSGMETNTIATNIDAFSMKMSFLFCFLKDSNDLEVYKDDILIKRLEGPYYSTAFYDNGDSVVAARKVDQQEQFFTIDANLNTEPFAWYDRFLRTVKGAYYFARRGKFFSCHLLTNGEEQWRLDLHEISGRTEGSIINDLIPYGDRLFMGIETGAVLCLDIPSGKIIERIPLGKSHTKLHEGLIYGAAGQKLSILNANTLQWHTIDFSNALTPNGFNFSSVLIQLQGDELLFEKERLFSNDNVTVIGVANLNTQELLWHTEISIEEGNFWLADLKIRGDKVGVLTQGGTLRVFEKTLA